MKKNFFAFIYRTIPLLFCLLIILLSQMVNSRFIFSSLLFIPIFYFAIFGPNLLNVFSVFFLGLFSDLINQVPLGLFSFIFVLLFFVARLNRLYLKELSFKTLWLLFIGISTIFLLLELFLFTLFEGSVVQTKFLFQQLTVLILYYPLGMYICHDLDDWIRGKL